MAPYPASLGAVVVLREASPTGISSLSLSSPNFEEGKTAPYLNTTIRSRQHAGRPETNLNTHSNLNLATRFDHNLTPRSDHSLLHAPFLNTSTHDNGIAARSNNNLTARACHNVTTRFDHNITTRSKQSLSLNFTAQSNHNLTTRLDHNLTVRSAKYAPYSNRTARSEEQDSAAAGHNNIVARSKHSIVAPSDHNLTGRWEHNSTARSAYQVTDVFGNITTRSDFNLTFRSEYNTSSQVDHNLTARTDYQVTNGLSNLTTRTEQKVSDQSKRDMFLRDQNASLASRSLVGRSTSTYVPCSGCLNPKKINNQAFFALFAILGVAMVAVSIWFFFHAKNGGFHIQEGDWEDYKSTVLRRKGPDGKTLSNATKSTKLGGGSIVAKHDRLAAMTVVGYDEKGRKGFKAKRGFGGTHSVYYSDDFSQYGGGSRRDEMSEIASLPDRQRRHHDLESHGAGHHSRRYRDRDVREYKHERPARVGGMNRPADGSNYDYSDRFSDSMTQITESTNRSTTNLIKDKPKDPQSAEKKRLRAEKKAHDDASRMERKWRKEAEAAAKAIARENAPSPVPPQQAHRARRDSRSNSPKKRDYSFSKGQDDISQSQHSRDRSATYYDAYRPQNETSASSSKTRQPSPTKAGYRRNADSDAATSDTGTRVYKHVLDQGPAKGKKSSRGGRDVMAGYRRGAGRDSEDEL
ncbi:hypothetical protein BDV97DRAFT_343567 [Delphinella strobiligena]|nr:hypothetical protein BDV97DRAFT_343567 [Delphinella strobiligena]